MLYLDLMEPDLQSSLVVALLYLQLLVYYVAHLYRLLHNQSVKLIHLMKLSTTVALLKR